MDHMTVGKMWDENAETWTMLARQGYDVCRDLVNTPAFLEMLPWIDGMDGLDIGCGEGYNTRQFASRGAHMQAIDISEKFIRYAQQTEDAEPLKIRYVRGSALELPFLMDTFHFVTATMSLMDMPDLQKVFGEVHRVLKPGGFFQFSIIHPCFQASKTRWVTDVSGRRIALECADYFRLLNGDIEEWTFGAAPENVRSTVKKFRIPRFTRTLSSWMNLISDSDFIFECMHEPYPSDEALQKCPKLYDLRIVAYFMIIRVRKLA